LRLAPLLVLAGCGGDPDDTGHLDFCEITVEHGSSATAIANCSGGICEVPAGEFVMGEADPRFPDRCPERIVSTDAYAIGMTEVTNSQFNECVADERCQERPFCSLDYSGDDTGELPATCVTLQDANDYCSWVDGRLPTEAEWERAARGDSGAIWPWGSQPPTCNLANFRFTTAYCHLSPIPVASFDVSSDFGLYDTAGNAWELVSGLYDAGFYRDSTTDNPQGPNECRELPDDPAGQCYYTTMRGGAFNTSETTTRGSARSFIDPEISDTNVGFRCAWDR
jgi:formylglycine-generating enzyme required for sulfatase activity